MNEPIDVELQEIIKNIQRRANRVRVVATILLALTVIIGVAAALFYTLTVAHIGYVGDFKEMSSGAEININSPKVATDEGILTKVTDAIVRLSSVLLSVFIITVLSSFSRYNFRLADFLSSRADSLLLAGRDIEKTKKYSDILNTESISFGKPATFSTNDILEGIEKVIGSRKGKAGSDDKS